jgi:hypothetical protein
MEHREALTSDLTTIDSSNNNKSHHHHHHHHHNRPKKRTTKQQRLQPLSLSKNLRVKSVSYTDPNTNLVKSQQQQQRSMRSSSFWKKRWTQWFSSCGSEHVSQVKSIPIAISIEVR